MNTPPQVDTRWAELSDHTMEVRFRQYDADHLRRSLRTVLLAVLVANAAVFVLSPGGYFDSTADTLITAAQTAITVLGLGVVLVLGRRLGPAQLLRWAVVLVLCFTAVTTLLTAGGDNISFTSPFMIVFGTVLIYLHVPITLRWITGLAVTFTAATLLGWLLGAGQPPAADVTFVVVVVLLMHATGFATARRTMIGRRQLFAQREILATLSSSDLLTGLPNRRSFETDLTLAWERTRATGEPLSMLMIDVDHFKEVNDRAGHAAGDETLRRIAETIGTALGGSTWRVCRYGGEEFACLLLGADPPAAHLVGLMVVQQVRQAGIERAGADDPLTVSIGVASASAGMASPAELVELADRQLYRAKDRGRNRVEPEDCGPAAPGDRAGAGGGLAPGWAGASEPGEARGPRADPGRPDGAAASSGAGRGGIPDGADSRMGAPGAVAPSPASGPARGDGRADEPDLVGMSGPPGPIRAYDASSTRPIRRHRDRPRPVQTGHGGPPPADRGPDG